MGFLERMRLGERLALGYALIVALMLVLLGVTLVQMAQVSAATSALTGEQAERMALAREWRENIVVNSVRALAVGLSASKELELAFTEDIKSTTQRTTFVQKRFVELETTPEGVAHQKKLAQIRTEYLRLRDALLASRQGGSIAQAVAAQRFGEHIKTYVAAADELVAHQQRRQAELGQQTLAAMTTARLVFLGVLGLCAAISVGLGWAITRSVTRPLQQVQAAANRIAAGDLSEELHAQGRTETQQLLASVGQMQQALRRLVGAVRSGADSIATASQQVAAGNADLSTRTEQTASNLQHTASSVEQLNATVSHTAESARSATTLAGSAADVAQRGGQVVHEVVATMNQIHDASRKINDIIGVIDGIAFQTNILALNAAVEAARAGEQGRGFAVVASEVRALAQRSANAAREIKTLINASVEKVESGTALVGTAGQTMDEIVASVRQVATLVGEISAAASEQSQGIGAVNGAVSQLDQMTQQNAALVEQSTAAAESLRQQADRLVQVVAAYRLEAGAAA